MTLGTAGARRAIFTIRPTVPLGGVLKFGKCRSDVAINARPGHQRTA